MTERGATGRDRREPSRPESLDAVGLLEMLGGPRGVVESAVPGVVFALVYGVNGQELDSALVAALVTAAALMVVSLLQRRQLRQAVGGFVGVAVMALVARYTGRAEDFYLGSLLKNGAYAAGFLVSIAVRWPLLGVFVGPVLGEGFVWRRDPARLHAYSLASWFWFGMFAIRLAVQVPLYLAGAVTALGLVNLPLGLPLFALTCWLSYLVIRRTPPVRRAHPAEGDGAGEGDPEVSRRPAG